MCILIIFFILIIGLNYYIHTSYNFLKNKDYYLDILFLISVNCFLRELLIELFNFNKRYYSHNLIIVSLTSVTCYLIRQNLIISGFSINFTHKNFIPYISFRIFLLTLLFIINPFLSFIISYILLDNCIIKYILPDSKSESLGIIPESSNISSNKIDGNKIIELAESANALSICTDLMKMGGEYIGLLNGLRMGFIDLNDKDTITNTHNRIIQLKTNMYELYQEGRPHLTSVNEFGYGTMLNGLSPEFFGPKGKEYVDRDISILQRTMRALTDLVNTFNTALDEQAKEVASDFRSKLNINSSVSDADIIKIVKSNAYRYYSTSSKSIATNIAKELGYEKLSDIKF
jgi:hypothetical protein